MTRSRLGLPLAALLFGLAASGCYASSHGTYGSVSVSTPPPEPAYVHYDYYDARPGSVWVEGRWVWTSAGWQWQPGYWVAARPGHVYVQGYWDYTGDRWFWRSGHWLRHRPGYHYQPGRWVVRNGDRVYVRGRWARGERVRRVAPRVRDHRRVAPRVRDHRRVAPSRDHRSYRGTPRVRDHRRVAPPAGRTITPRRNERVPSRRHRRR